MLNINSNTGSRFSRKLESVIWFIVRLLPLIFFFAFSYPVLKNDGFLGSSQSNFSEIYSFPEYLYKYVGVNYDNVIYSALSQIFEVGGVFPVFATPAEIGDFNPILWYVSYLAFVEIIRIMFDVIVFIPRLAHKWISKAVQE